MTRLENSLPRGRDNTRQGVTASDVHEYETITKDCNLDLKQLSQTVKAKSDENHTSTEHAYLTLSPDSFNEVTTNGIYEDIDDL